LYLSTYTLTLLKRVSKQKDIWVVMMWLCKVSVLELGCFGVFGFWLFLRADLRFGFSLGFAIDT
jgi:hypothetical protein